MATLYDLAMQYLNQSLPKTFKYDRTNQPGSTPPVNVLPQTPNVSTAGISSGQGGGGGGNDFSVYNPDPNNTRDSNNYIKRPYMEANPSAFFDLNNPNEMSGLDRPKGLGGAIQSYLENNILGKVTDMLPVNRTGILQNELLGSGFQLNNIGQIVASNAGSAYDPSGLNVMAGYNASKVTKETFAKRRAKAKEKMSPEGFAKFNTALTAAEDKFFGASDRTKTVFDAESLKKNPDYISQDVINQKMQEAVEGEDDSDSDILDYTDKNIYNTPSIYTQTAPTYTTDPYVSGQDDKDIDTTPPGTSDDGYVTDYYGGDSVIDAGGTAPGGGYATDYYGGDSVTDAGGTAPGGGYATDYYGGGGDQYSDDNYMAGDTSTAASSGSIFDGGSAYEDQSYSGGSDSGGGNNSGGKSIVCTAMYQTTGLEDWSKAMKIWYIYQKKYLTIQHQEGYHKLFKPFVKGMHKNKIIRAIGAHIAKHRTQDLKHIMFGSKSSWLGRVYRKILEPICYFVGKHG